MSLSSTRQGRGCVHAHIIINFEGPSPEQLKEVDKWIWTKPPDASIANGELRQKKKFSTWFIKIVVRSTLLHPA